MSHIQCLGLQRTFLFGKGLTYSYYNAFLEEVNIFKIVKWALPLISYHCHLFLYYLLHLKGILVTKQCKTKSMFLI